MSNEKQAQSLLDLISSTILETLEKLCMIQRRQHPLQHIAFLIEEDARKWGIHIPGPRDLSLPDDAPPVVTDAHSHSIPEDHITVDERHLPYKFDPPKRH